MNLVTAKYVGPVPTLRGFTALIREDGPPCDARGDRTVLAQFDNWGAERDGVDLSHGWHTFSHGDFEFPAEPEDQMEKGDASWCVDPDMGDQ